jgi:uncharacterized protein YjhX (UPF0386 family)
MAHRSRRIWLAGLCGLLGLAAPLLRAADDPKEILRRALRMNAHNRELERTYTYLERNEGRTLDGKGAVKHRESTTWDVTPLEKAMYRRLIQRDDKPLSPKEERQQEAALQKREAARKEAEAKRAAETPEQRQKRLAAKERARQHEQRDIDEVVEGFDLRLLADERIDGVPVWAIEGAPREGYKFTNSQFAAVVSKLKGRIWVSQSDYQPVRIDAETTGTISFGGVLARIYKGTRVHVEFTYVNGEVWLPKHMSFRVSGRLLLLKGLREEGDAVFSGYKKFSADSRIVTGED